MVYIHNISNNSVYCHMFFTDNHTITHVVQPSVRCQGSRTTMIPEPLNMVENIVSYFQSCFCVKLHITPIFDLLQVLPCGRQNLYFTDHGSSPSVCFWPGPRSSYIFMCRNPRFLRLVISSAFPPALIHFLHIPGSYNSRRQRNNRYT